MSGEDERALNDRRIVVTGAGGFLGPVAVDAFARRGARVQAIIGPPREPARIPAGASWIAEADICDAAALRPLLAGADAVVHLAGPASVAASFEDPARYVRVHTEGTAALLQACRAAGVTRVVYVSSAEVYGRPRQNPVAEDHPLSARSFYGAAKIGAEKVIEAAALAFGLRAVILRPFSVYGPGASPVSLIPRIIAQARAGGPIELRDLRPIRDYCFVGDVAEAIVRACASGGTGFDVFNLGTMRGASVAAVAAMVVEALGSTCQFRERGDRDRPGSSEILELVADNRHAREGLGWAPEVTLEAGLRRMLTEEGT